MIFSYKRSCRICSVEYRAFVTSGLQSRNVLKTAYQTAAAPIARSRKGGPVQASKWLARTAEKLFRQLRRHQYDTVPERRDKAVVSLPQREAGVFATTHWSVVL